jgi:hypothetical protein
VITVLGKVLSRSTGVLTLVKFPQGITRTFFARGSGGCCDVVCVAVFCVCVCVVVVVVVGL